MAGPPERDDGPRHDRAHARSNGRERYGTVPARRLFVAVPLPEPVRARVGELVSAVQAEVDGDDRPVRWVRVDGLHLTVRFLGATTPERQAAVEAAVRATAAARTPVRIGIGGAGAFPSASRPRVLWLGLRAGAESLAEIAAELETRLVEAGWPAEGRPFAAHLTLARCDGARSGPRTASALIARAQELDVDWVADRLTLFESHVGGGPARYEALVEVPLGQGGGTPA
jgi:2'-5' RNA ligase